MQALSYSRLGSVVNAKNDLFRMINRWKDVNSGRIFMAFASLVKPEDVDVDSHRMTYTIRVADILSNTSGSMFKEIDKATQTLMEQVISKRFDGERFVKYHLFDTIEYNQGYITGTISNDILPFFLIAREGVIEGGYTKIYLSQYLKLKSIYSQKLFTYLKSWSKGLKSGFHQVALSNLHELLDTPESLRKNYKDFRVRVLKPACEDITNNTTLRYTWEPVKTGRSVTHIKFTFSPASTAVIDVSEPAVTEGQETSSVPEKCSSTTEMMTTRCFMARNCTCRAKEFPMCTYCRHFDSPENRASQTDADGTWTLDVGSGQKSQA